MPLDTRRELAHIWKQYSGFQRVIGEDIIWFRFDTENSRFDDVYDEGGRTYLPGVRLPILWVDQIEDPEQYTPDGGRRPQQRMRFAVSSRVLEQKGISAKEAHGRTLDVVRRSNPLPEVPGRPMLPWYDDRLNDVIYYDQRFYSISNFQIRGRAKHEDAIVGVSSLEFIPEDESIWDLFPSNTPYGDAFGTPLNPYGVSLIATVGTPASWDFTHEVNILGDWSFVVRDGENTVLTLDLVIGEDGKTVSPSLSVDDIEMLDGTGPDHFEWKMVQTYEGDPHVPWTGTLFIVSDSFDIALSPESPGSDEQVITLQAIYGQSSIWTLVYGAEGLVGSWSADVVDEDGEVVATFVVDTSLSSLGRIGLFLPSDELIGVVPGQSYTWRVRQQYLSHPAAIVSSGPFILGAF